MDVRLPKLGEGADSGVVVGLLVKEGDMIKEGQPIIELENEKAVAPIPSTASGTVTKIRVKEGDKVSVGQVILSIDSVGVEVSPARAPSVVERPKPAESSSARIELDEAAVEEVAATSATEIVAGPSIRKLARDLGIDLRRVRPSERGGRLVLADLRVYVQGLQRLAS